MPTKLAKTSKSKTKQVKTHSSKPLPKAESSKKTVSTKVSPKKQIDEKKHKTEEKNEKEQVQLSPVKQEIIEKFQIKSNDTGSPEVQIALLSNRIDKLVNHLKSNPQDNHSRRGLLGIVSKRRRLLHYLETKDMKRYKEIAKKVGLAK